MTGLSIQDTSLLMCSPLYATLAKYLNFKGINIILALFWITVHDQLGLG